MRTVYGRAWNQVRLRIGGVIGEEQARLRYLSGGKDDWFSVGAYADGVPDGAAPEYTMEVTPQGGFISVSFYDQLCRVRFEFLFGKTDAGVMFLEEIYDFRYPDETTYYTRSGCVTNTNYRYRPDGSMHWRLTDKVANVTEQADYRDIDVSTHWEPVPEFGEWASITRFDRTKPVGA
ncbi:hypothetical protein [uncultured Microbacterium sp.]|jgi:hypothetical protein|uniref:hypothetical protein n=1 Tax=uncultured Microbacterium sp. TaxID=191216 RepID=UPI0030F5DA17